MLSKKLDRLADDRLIELGFGVNRVSPEGNSHQTDTCDHEVTYTLERPLHYLQHTHSLSTNTIKLIYCLHTQQHITFNHNTEHNYLIELIDES